MKKLKLLILLLTVLAASGCSRQNKNEQVIKNVDNTASRTDVITADTQDDKSESTKAKDSSRLLLAYINDQDEKKYGFIDQTGAFVISPIYDQASDFSEGYAVVYSSEDNEYNVIDETGKSIYKSSYSIGDFHEGMAVFDDYKDGKTIEGYIDTTGSVVLPAIYDKASVFEGGNAYVYADNQIQQIDKTGKILSSHDINVNDIYITDFYDGYIVYNSVGNSVMEAMDYKGKKLPLPNNVSSDYTGYGNLMYLGNDIFAVMQKSETEDYSSTFTTPYALFKADGTQLTDYIFYDLSKFSDGFASATDDTTTFFINTLGKVSDTLPKFDGRGTLTLTGDIIKAEIDGILTYETTDGKVIYQTTNDVKLTDSLTLKAEKFKPNKYAVIYYPVLSGLSDSSTAKAINENLYKIFIDKRKDLKKEDNLSVEDSFDGKVINNILLVNRLGYDYSFGAAHGMPIDDYYPIDLKTGETYKLQDLFLENSNYVEILSKIIAAKIKEESKKGQSIYFQDAFTSIQPDQYFHLDADNLYIYFSPYDIAPYAAGFPEFKISFNSISNIINKEGDFWKSLHGTK
ncbi:WG repeat-containing protein [Anaerocolumna xylanovorans]|uniref:WG containing repeat-containing protein n=1 Tax=Anaerocolumna xylanovorans DSM 12503 TaxID=1121345 RepID=A0A1M7XZS4_9FIRM|nr:WG repeat-containing protein [Anaerocolumna xylanovorans]SHO44747.1 WG containing repeat-containing protein [Anaerocolumna xylanovorans DSM 12503]